jgi:hypothetical protein
MLPFVVCPHCERAHATVIAALKIVCLMVVGHLAQTAESSHSTLTQTLDYSQVKIDEALRLMFPQFAGPDVAIEAVGAWYLRLQYRAHLYLDSCLAAATAAGICAVLPCSNLPEGLCSWTHAACKLSMQSVIARLEHQHNSPSCDKQGEGLIPTQ